MRGYPRYVATKQDYINLLQDTDLHDQAVADLITIRDLGDDTVLRVVSGSEETGDLVTEEIDNPMPTWKHKGFATLQELADLISEEE
jgi:hypothetical protein